MYVYTPPCTILAHEPVPINRPTSILTPRGAVAVQVIRLGYALEDLAGEDRAYIVGMLREIVEGTGA
jgi:hypothetical protein